MHGKGAAEDEEEVPVVEWSLKDVLVFNAYLSAVDHVEKLEEAEHIEDNGENVQFGLTLVVCDTIFVLEVVILESTRVVWALKNVFKLGVGVPAELNVGGKSQWTKDEDKQNKDSVVSTESNDLSPDVVLLEKRSLLIWITLDDGSHRRLRSQAQSSKGIHDHVDPQKLGS